ncbi:MAG: ABC transporter substrate-binding protein [Nocardioidaceae bacterium]|nr:ABC transporter substrate-binding protein [Nocardioidaceae bacterium]NUS52419.1 ABC transporter substrate-binding protein [Nocardioidaceae bacterium]
MIRRTLTQNLTRHLTRRAAAGLLALTAATGLAACSSASGNDQAVRDDGSVDLSKVTLTVGDQKGGSQALLRAAGDIGRTPYKVEFKTFTSGPPLLEALNAGAIDIGGVGNTPPLFAAAAKSNLEVVSGAQMGAKGDAIVVPKDSPIESVADLKGKKVAVAEGSSANYNLLAQLDKAGLTYQDVKAQNLQPADALAAFSSGHVDAWAVWDPYTSQAELEAGGRILVDGAGTVNGMTFQAANPDALDDKATAAAIEDYLKRIARAQKWSNTHRERWAQVWAEDSGLSPEVTRRAVDRRVARPVPLDAKVVGSEQEMADTFAANDLVPSKFDVSDYFSDRFNQSVPNA